LPLLDAAAPLRYAESWDNVGLLVGDPDAEIARIVVTVDYSPAVAAEARERGANLVVAYHPPMFAAVKRVPHDALWAAAVRDGIGLYSMHTALDAVVGGTNELLLRACGVTTMKPIRDIAKRTPEDSPDVGMGRIGQLTAPTTLAALAQHLKRELELETVLVAGAEEAPISRVAVVAGAGGEFLSDAIRQKADVFVTGELRHHDALRGTPIIATLHSNSERKAVRAWGTKLVLPGVEVLLSERDKDPFYFR
jgi:dinuclear metal center YbgI/SA1388 family protein